MQKSPSTPGLKEPVPVRYEMKGFNSLLGSHYDHYYLEYDWFSFEQPSEDVFRIAESMHENLVICFDVKIFYIKLLYSVIKKKYLSLADATCVSFPGPGENHIYTFNPMQEFIHNYEDHLHEAFNKFKKTHQRTYKDVLDNVYRKNIFRQNIRYTRYTHTLSYIIQFFSRLLFEKKIIQIYPLYKSRQLGLSVRCESFGGSERSRIEGFTRQAVHSRLQWWGFVSI